jgi:cystathionine beta-lyase
VETHPVSIDFDQEFDRWHTNSIKYDGAVTQFGTGALIPLWVADMDFAAPEAVTHALVQRANHPIYGYTLYPKGMTEALVSWLQKRHGWTIQPEWIVFCPGVVTALHAGVLATTKPGDGVIVQNPVYPPFYTCVTSTGRVLVENPLRLDAEHYSMNFDQLEQAASAGARLLLLCSPHNPVGRVWKRDELEQVLAIARRHQLTILADEIHGDLVYPGGRHLPLAGLAGPQDNIITAVAPSKTFNIPGLGLSALIVQNAEQRKTLQQVFNQLHIQANNPFSISAFEAAYGQGEPWLDSLLEYLQVTRDQVRDYLHQHLPEIKLIEPEGTYLLWLDCRALQMSDNQLQQFMVEKAQVGLSPGIQFGREGSGFMRMNIGAPRKKILRALEQIRQAVATLKLC